MKSKDTLRSFELVENVYALGVMERGVTIYNQQVRAHNLTWAISQAAPPKEPPSSFAIIGGGIAGLTTAACLADKFPRASISIFEKRSDLCPLQQGADHRYIQPKIYNWPDADSLKPETDLPWLLWKQGRASEVSQQVLKGFNEVCQEREDRYQPPFEVWLSVEHIQINLQNLSIEWVGKKARFDKGFFQASEGVGAKRHFDKVVIAAGFGLETAPASYVPVSYWRNEHRSQPILDGLRETVLISGFGDGALTDLCRATIERFQQDLIVGEMFPSNNIPSDLVELKDRVKSGANLFDELLKDDDLHAGPIEAVRRRLRKDTKVFLHLGGAKGKNTDLAAAFGDGSSFLNRYMLYLLYRCGAFTPIFGSLDAAVATTQVAPSGIICRHGADTLTGIQSLFQANARKAVERRLLKMKKNQFQHPHPAFELGFFKKEYPQ